MDAGELNNMAIKMRNNKNENAICCECGETQKEVLRMYDLCIGDKIFTICDVCNEKIFNKTLHASVLLQGDVRTPRDNKIILARNAKKSGKYGPRYD